MKEEVEEGDEQETEEKKADAEKSDTDSDSKIKEIFLEEDKVDRPEVV